MVNSAKKVGSPLSGNPTSHAPGLPPEIVGAQRIKWEVFIDAYLAGAAKLGQRYIAKVYSDRSGISEDGMTVTTPPVRHVMTKEGFELIRSLGGDHYVITSEHGTGSL